MKLESQQIIILLLVQEVLKEKTHNFLRRGSNLDLTLEMNLSLGLVSVRAYIQVGLAIEFPW